MPSDFAPNPVPGLHPMFCSIWFPEIGSIERLVAHADHTRGLTWGRDDSARAVEGQDSSCICNKRRELSTFNEKVTSASRREHSGCDMVPAPSKR